MLFSSLSLLVLLSSLGSCVFDSSCARGALLFTVTVALVSTLHWLKTFKSALIQYLAHAQPDRLTRRVLFSVLHSAPTSYSNISCVPRPRRHTPLNALISWTWSLIFSPDSLLSGLIVLLTSCHLMFHLDILLYFFSLISGLLSKNSFAQSYN